jgi:uncharacterized protein with GYD domain
MPSYLYQVAYTPEAWATLVKSPQDRIEAVRPVVEAMGGRIVCAYFAFGDYDLVAIAEYPGNVGAAAFSMAATAGGALKAIRTTPLMSIDEGIEAMRLAAGAGYSPPEETELME